MPRAQIKDEKTYQALRREGNSEPLTRRAGRAHSAPAGGPARGSRQGPFRWACVSVRACERCCMSSFPGVGNSRTGGLFHRDSTTSHIQSCQLEEYSV